MLRKLGNDEVYLSPTCLYDFRAVISKDFRSRVVASIDSLYEQAQRLSGAAQVLVSGTAARSPRQVQFFDDRTAFIDGTRSKLPTRTDYAGLSYWSSAQDASINNPETPIKDRENQRIWLNPTTNIFGRILVTTWHEMTHQYTNLHHGNWSSQGGFTEPNSDENRSWQAFMDQLKNVAPESAEDPAPPGGTEYIRVQQWTCRCGMHTG